MLQLHTPSLRHHKKHLVQYLKLYNLLGDKLEQFQICLSFQCSVYHFVHFLFAVLSIIVAQSNFILHSLFRKVFAVKTNGGTNPNGSNIEAAIFYYFILSFFIIALSFTSSLSNVNDSNMKLSLTTFHVMSSVLSLISLLKIAPCNDFSLSFSGQFSLYFRYY